MIKKKDYENWLARATRKEIVFVNTYLKTLDAYQAYDEAGYNYAQRRFGKWKVYHKLFPIIQYKLKTSVTDIDKKWLIAKWITMAESKDLFTSSNALKEIGKLLSFYDPDTQVTIENNIPQTPVVIKFGEDFKENGK